MTGAPYPIPDAALDEDIAVLGRKGGGKTFTAKGIVERLLDMRRRVLILDPLGVWAGLRTSADGKRAGYKIAIFGGLHADMPLDPAAAEPLAQIIAVENLPAIIDLSELSKGEQQSFLLSFLRELRRANHDALTVVLEEADVFAPQNPLGDDSKALHGEIDWIARRGRSRGFRLLTITQRPARLSKDVLTQANTLIIHRLPSPQDRRAAEAWVNGNGDQEKSREVFNTLAGLAVGEAWVLAQDPPMLGRYRFPIIRTLDTSATPKAGEKRIEPKTLAEVDVSGIRDALAAAKAPAGAPTRRAVPTAPDPALLKAEYARGHAAGYTLGWREAAQKVNLWASDFLSAQTPMAPNIVAQAAPPPKTPVVVDGRAAPSKIGPERRALALLVAIYPAGYTDAQWAIAAGFRRTGGTWGTYKSRLRLAGRIAESGNGIFQATELGVRDCGDDIETPPTAGDGLARWWGAKLGVRRLMDALIETYPAPVGRLALAEAVGMTASGGTFGSYMSRLRSNGMIEETADGIRISTHLMEQRS